MRTRIAADPPAPDTPRGKTARLSARGSELVGAELEALSKDGLLAKASLIDLFHRLAGKGHEIRVIYVPGQWLDVDNVQDLRAAGQFL